MNRDTPKHSGKSSFIYPTQMRASPEIPEMRKTKKTVRHRAVFCCGKF